MNRHISIFGISLDSLENKTALQQRFEAMLESENSHVVFTPNPEILMQARSYPAYAEVLSGADLLIPDGSGIQLISRLRYGFQIFRYPGIDVGRMLLDLAYAKRLRVMFLGGRNGSAISAAERLTKSHSDFQIYAAGDNVEVTEDGYVPDPKEEHRIIDAIRQTKPAIVLVGLGAPKQEQWIVRHQHTFPSVKIFIGVGGAFDIWSGRLKRAPAFMRALGLEWLWRFLLEPRRLPRIMKAVIVFPYAALREQHSEHE